MKPSLVIIGLGNPGRQYVGTRHNAGYRAVEILGEEFGTGAWQPKQKFLCDVLEGRIGVMPILLIKPTTYMNDSGNCVKKIVDFYKLNPAKQLLVLFDDIDLPAGESKLLEKGGPGTHNGMRSIVSQIGEEFVRFKIGVLGSDAPRGSFQKAGMDLSNYILSKPNQLEEEMIESELQKIPALIKEYVIVS